MVGASSRRGRQVRQGAMTTFSSPASSNRSWPQSVPDGTGAAAIGMHAVWPGARRRARSQPVCRNKKEMGPPYAVTHWRSRATRKQRLTGKCGFAGQREWRRQA